MLVQVVSFGSNWWARFGQNAGDPYRFTRRACYYNSTGIACGHKIRRHWIVPGLIRFNGAGDFHPHHPERSLNQTFHCSELTQLFGGNRMLFERKAHRDSIADRYLVAVSSGRFGQIDLQANAWKGQETVVVAASQLHDRQEILLLMKPKDWIRTSSGLWRLTAFGGRAKARLEFAVEEDRA